MNVLFDSKFEAMTHKVLHILTSLDFGGVERHMELIASWRGTGQYSHEFLAIGSGGAAEASIARSGCSVCCLNINPKIPNLRALWRLYKYIIKAAPYVVHTHGAEANFHGLIASRIAGVPVRVGEEIGIPARTRTASQIFRFVFSLANVLVAVSAVVERWLLDNGEVKSRKIKVLNCPVAFNRIRPSQKTFGDEFVVCWVGRLEKVKNPIAVLHAFARFSTSRPDTKLWIIGDGSLRSELEDQIKELGLQDVVELMGYLPDPESIIINADLFVQSSHSEGFSLALVEAMGIGLPVIVSNVGAAKEIVSDGISGWIIDEPTVDRIYNSLVVAYSMSSEALHQMGFIAADAVRKKHSLDIYMEHLHVLYSQHSAIMR